MCVCVCVCERERERERERGNLVWLVFIQDGIIVLQIGFLKQTLLAHLKFFKFS